LSKGKLLVMARIPSATDHPEHDQQPECVKSPAPRALIKNSTVASNIALTDPPRDRRDGGVDHGTLLAEQEVAERGCDG